MKKLILFIVTLSLSLIFSPSQLSAKSINEPAPNSVERAANEIKAKALLNRLYEIKEMDVSTLNSSEKKALRKEVRSIRSELKMMDGLYISFGLIIIILLLIILI